MVEFPLDVIKERPVVTIDGRRVLLSTASPMSLGEMPLPLLGRSHALRAGFMGVTPQAIGELLETHVDVVAGADVFDGHHVLIDRPGARVVLSREPIACDAVALPTRLMMGVPVVEFEHGGRAARGLLDSSAGRTFLDPDTAKDYPAAGTARDFFPGAGVFDTPLHRVGLEVAGRTIDAECGIAPGAVLTMLRMAGVRWILGADLFRAAGVLIDYPGKQVSVVFPA